MSLKALGDRMVVEPRGRDETTKGGIVLPGTATARPQQRQVVAAGPGMQVDGGTRVELDLKIGGTVLFAKYSGTELKDEPDDLLILSERDVLAVIEDGVN